MVGGGGVIFGEEGRWMRGRVSKFIGGLGTRIKGDSDQTELGGGWYLVNRVTGLGADYQNLLVVWVLE